ncbi:MAG: glycoside hydrolase family 140 protein [Thermoproteota archaeon]
MVEAVRKTRLRVFLQENHPGDGHFIVGENKQPFFYLGDTAWELFHRLSYQEAEHYLRDRAGKKFNVIQAVVISEFNGLTVPNKYGELPLHNNDPRKPNNRYFDYVDLIIDLANSLGLYVGVLPTWGDKVNKKWGGGPEIFTPENAREYGEFLGRRLRDKMIIWILGGDRPCESEAHYAVWRSMAEGLRMGDDGSHLITYHPMGGMSSSRFFHNEPWLDFNMLQSGHSARNIPNYEMIRNDYDMKPTKPCLDGEARYEDHPINWNPENGWFDDHDARQAAYWGVFAGAFGHTYGCHDIWQFFEIGREPISYARTPWKAALNLPGASQMQHLRSLIESFPMLNRIPDQSMIANDVGKGAEHIQATRGADCSYALVYIPTGREVALSLNRFFKNRLVAYWYNPRTGVAETMGELDNAPRKTFTPPSSGPKEDWVLVLIDKDAERETRFPS